MLNRITRSARVFGCMLTGKIRLKQYKRLFRKWLVNNFATGYCGSELAEFYLYEHQHEWAKQCAGKLNELVLICASANICPHAFKVKIAGLQIKVRVNRLGFIRGYKGVTRGL